MSECASQTQRRKAETARQKPQGRSQKAEATLNSRNEKESDGVMGPQGLKDRVKRQGERTPGESANQPS